MTRRRSDLLTVFEVAAILAIATVLIIWWIAA